MLLISYLWDSTIPPYAELFSVNIQYKKSCVNLLSTHFCNELKIKAFFLFWFNSMIIRLPVFELIQKGIEREKGDDPLI